MSEANQSARNVDRRRRGASPAPEFDVEHDAFVCVQPNVHHLDAHVGAIRPLRDALTRHGQSQTARQLPLSSWVPRKRTPVKLAARYDRSRAAAALTARILAAATSPLFIGRLENVPNPQSGFRKICSGA